jgi:hypothetical protein
MSQDSNTSILYAEAALHPRATRALSTVSTRAMTKRSVESPLPNLRTQVEVLSTCAERMSW